MYMGFLDIFRKTNVDNRQSEIDNRQSEIDNLKTVIGDKNNTIKIREERIDKLEQEIKELNNKIFELLESKIQQKEEIKEPVKVKLTPKEEDVLKVVQENPKKSNIELSKILNLTPGSLNVYKNKLKNKGYL